MDYYEELGLRRTASIQEIRRTYKVLARLVHPDRQMDEQMRGMAQRQMQRLNEILATLTDEASRRAYDAALADVRSSQVVVPPGSGRPGRRRHFSWWLNPRPWEAKTESCSTPLPGWAQSAVRNWFWISLVLAAAAVGVWCGAQERPSPERLASRASPQNVELAIPEKTQPRRGKATGKASGVRVKKLRVPATSNQGSPIGELAERGTALAAGLPSGQAPQALGVPANQPEFSKTGSAAAGREPAKTTTAGANTRAEALCFAGNWISAEDPAEKPLPGIYPARYVELLLVEERGQLSGSYRAQYKVLDRAVSPEVSFRVHGDTPAGTLARLRWTSADGAKGEMEVVLDGPRLMKLSWWSTQLGRHATLASGTALLVREQVR
jgi:curved DNA-binding protein CbpA